ncbi:hypothetical protein [Hymenobacter elongatus]|uniref:VCBS repeat-containing protein n=1 Tax=Hymenobacter elongatus TaxID=877208 RepID=A0A4Z0PH38_9BACT|nr:hypothetical protein [Hymenobacter elongatus]TGE14063.1 hypothetical protein E5J99_17565 [Hymenobacter elongatus]
MATQKRVFLIIIAVVLMQLGGFAQSNSSQIDAAKTDAQVQNLVRSVDKYYANFTVKSSLRFEDKRVEKQYRKAGVKAWEKADFDGNGHTDLLITGTHYDQESKVICLLNMGESLVLEPFDRQFYQACPIARISYDGKQPLVSYTDFEKPFLSIDSLQGKKVFSLIYKYGGFIEYNKNSVQVPALDSMMYESSFAYHEVMESKLTMDAAGKASYNSCEWPVLDEAKKQCEKLTGTIGAQSFSDIVGLIYYIDPVHLKPKYRVNVNHVPYATLRFSYAGNRKVEISDRGETGTFGLMRLYALLGQLRKTQQWQSAH